jgi:predicted RecA/RadA family phage recombinase
LLAEYVMTGVQNFIIENYARFTVLLSALSMWIGESSALLAMGGGIIANHVITGMQTMFAPIEYWNAITTSFGTFVDSVGDDHAISAKAIKLGKKISQKIGQGVKDNWKAIADGISEAVQRAIDSVKVETTSAGAPPASGGAATTTPTSGRSIPMPVSVGAAMYDVSRRIAASEGAQARGSTGDINISITIQGDAVIDDDKRMNKLADVISRKIGRNMKYAGAFG